MRMVIARQHHLQQVKVPDLDELERQQSVEAVAQEPFAKQILAQYARSLEHGGEVMAVFGVWPLWAGVGRSWSMISEDCRRHFGKTLYKSVKGRLEYIEQRDGMHRIEAIVRVGHPTAHSWIRHLGFKREGLMVNYGPGGIGDSHLYARTRP